jgi:hypothetical protein
VESRRERRRGGEEAQGQQEKAERHGQTATFWIFCVIRMDKRINFAALFAYLDV